MKKLTITACLLALGLASTAHAADIIVQQTLAPVVQGYKFSWAGVYAGGQIGGRWTDTKARANNPEGDFYSGKYSADPSGFMGGLYAGYNFDIGNNLILGIETDWAWGDLSDGHSRYFDDENITFRNHVKEKWNGATRLRLGYAVDRWLPYVAGGVAYARVQSKFSEHDFDDDTSETASATNTMTGWTIGAGADYAMTDHVLLRLEYRYSDYGSKTTHFMNLDDDRVSSKLDYKTNDVRVGIAYKF